MTSRLIDAIYRTGVCIVAVSFIVAATADERCGPDKVWGGEKCEWRDICKDGSPRRGGACPGEPTVVVEAEVPPRPQPAPRPTPVTQTEAPPPAPVVCPSSHMIVDGHCVPKPAPVRICADGKPAINGKCPPVPRQCEQRVLFHSSSENLQATRRVLLVGGPLSSLFDRYLQESKKAARPVDLEALTVYYFDRNGVRKSITEEMSIGAFFQGKTLTQVWQRAMRNKTGAQRRDAEFQARTLASDLLCGDAAQ